MHRTTVAIDAGLWRRLREEAARRGMTIQGCINDFLRIGLNAGSRTRSAAEPFRIPTFSMGRFLVDPADREAMEAYRRRP